LCQRKFVHDTDDVALIDEAREVAAEVGLLLRFVVEFRLPEVVDEVLDLFIQLDASEDYLESPFVFASARAGYATMDFNNKTEDMKTLLDVIVDYIPAPVGDENAPFKLLISTTDYNEYVGRIGIGKIESGSVKLGDRVY